MRKEEFNTFYCLNGKEKAKEELNKMTREELADLYKYVYYNRVRAGKRETVEDLINKIMEKVINNPMNNWDVWNSK